MMRRASYILGSGLVNLAQSGSSSSQPAAALIATVISTRTFRAVADFEIDFSNRETLKKYVGVRDHLSKEHGTRKRLIDALNVLMKELEVLPPSSEYRRAVEASTNYRLQVCEANDSDPAIEEVLDAHIEELIKECREESRIIPVMLKETCVKKFYWKRGWECCKLQIANFLDMINKMTCKQIRMQVPLVSYHDANEILAKKK